MIVPTFNNLKFVEENGYLTPEMLNYFTQLNESMTNALSDNGWTIPNITAAELAAITAGSIPANRQMPAGTMWYVRDSVPANLVVKIGNNLFKILTAPYP